MVSKLTSRVSEGATTVVALFSKLISHTCHEHHMNLGLRTSSEGNYSDDRSIEDIRMDLIALFSVFVSESQDQRYKILLRHISQI